MANCNLVGHWASAGAVLRARTKQNLICWGGLTAGDWQYIGSQGVIQGTYEIFARIARARFRRRPRGPLRSDRRAGGMGGAQPLAGTHGGAAILCVEVDEERIAAPRRAGLSGNHRRHDLDEALEICNEAQASQAPAFGRAVRQRGGDLSARSWRAAWCPDIVTDQTSAHDLYGYVPCRASLSTQAAELRTSDPRAGSESAGSRQHRPRTCARCSASRERGAVVFDNGNLIRTQAKRAGVDDAFDIRSSPSVPAAALLPRHRPVPLGRAVRRCRRHRAIDDLCSRCFPTTTIVTNWIRLARKHVPFQGLPARIAWLGHGERTRLGARW